MAPEGKVELVEDKGGETVLHCAIAVLRRGNRREKHRGRRAFTLESRVTLGDVSAIAGAGIQGWVKLRYGEDVVR